LFALHTACCTTNSQQIVEANGVWSVYDVAYFQGETSPRDGHVHTQLLPEVFPEIDANRMSFYEGRGEVENVGQFWSLQNAENAANFLFLLGIQKLKSFQHSGARLTPDAMSLDAAGGPRLSDSCYRLALSAPPHIFGSTVQLC